MNLKTVNLIKTGLLALGFTLLNQNATQAQASTFEQVWNSTQEGAYRVLPEHPVTTSSFVTSGINLLKQSADRTLNTSNDVMPRFQKLVHPVGICFSGIWKITERSRYTGYFSEGSQALIIVRASEALGQPEKGDYRSFGFAGKLFPTTDRKENLSIRTANFFTVDDLGGTMADSFLELPKLNEPKTSFHVSSVFSLPMLTTIIKAFSSADNNPGIRPLYPIAELGLKDPRKAIAPHWMMIQSIGNSTFSETPEDFRNELRLSRFPDHKLTFRILVSEKGDSQWLPLGMIELNEEALSEGCDHRLHFAHPKSR